MERRKQTWEEASRTIFEYGVPISWMGPCRGRRRSEGTREAGGCGDGSLWACEQQRLGRWAIIKHERRCHGPGHVPCSNGHVLSECQVVVAWAGAVAPEELRDSDSRQRCNPANVAARPTRLEIYCQARRQAPSLGPIGSRGMGSFALDPGMAGHRQAGCQKKNLKKKKTEVPPPVFPMPQYLNLSIHSLVIRCAACAKPQNQVSGLFSVSYMRRSSGDRAAH